MNTDFWLDKMTWESRHTRELRHLLHNKFAKDRKKVQHVQILLPKVELLSLSATTLGNLQ